MVYIYLIIGDYFLLLNKYKLNYNNNQTNSDNALLHLRSNEKYIKVTSGALK